MKKSLFSFIIYSLLVCSSCRRGDPCAGITPIPEKYYLDTTYINKSVYLKDNKFDTLIFASNKGDTFVFVQPMKDTLWWKESYSGNPDCGITNIDSYQIFHSKYKCIQGGGLFEIWYLRGGTIVFKNSNSPALDDLEIRFNGYHFIFYIPAIGYNADLNNIPMNAINGRVYTNSQYSINENEDFNKIGYLNMPFGLYAVVDSTTNTTLSLINH